MSQSASSVFPTPSLTPDEPENWTGRSSRLRSSELAGYDGSVERATDTEAPIHRDKHASTGLVNASVEAVKRAVHERLAPIADHLVRPAKPRVFFQALENWEGTVLEVREETFVARLTDPLGERKDEEAEFFTDDVSEWDRKLLAPGAVFYWSLGRTIEPTGATSRTSTLRFRRLPAWSRPELARAEERAESLATAFESVDGRNKQSS